MSPLWKEFFELGAGVGQLFQGGQSIPKHVANNESPGRLIEAPEGFDKIGVEFKQLADEPLRNLAGGQVHAIQSSKQG